MSKIEIYTDGACSGNPGPGGWGFAIIIDEKLSVEKSGGTSVTTNNRMEMQAVIEALQFIDDDESLKSQTINLYTDSNYVKQGITSWIHNWKKNNWRTANKTPVKNQELWQAIDELANRLDVKWFWVRGHNNNPYNELCDKLAVNAVKQNEGVFIKH